MPAINLKVDGDAAWPDLQGREIIDCGDRIGMAALNQGMRSGRPSVAIRVDLPDGRVVFVQTSLRALETAVGALVARYGTQL